MRCGLTSMIASAPDSPGENPASAPDGRASSRAGRLTDRGDVDVTQGVRVVDIASAHGPVRIR
jgi:uncharacterized protein DUF3253